MRRIFNFLLIATLILSLISCKSSDDTQEIQSKTYIGHMSLDGDTLILDEFEFITKKDKEDMFPHIAHVECIALIEKVWHL